jgi:hypothetical protein
MYFKSLPGNTDCLDAELKNNKLLFFFNLNTLLPKIG